MGMDIEVVGITWYTVHLTDEDVEKVKKFMKDNEDILPHGKTRIEDRQQENFCWAVDRLVNYGEIELYSDDKASKDAFVTEKINWSEIEERTVDEILGV